ncbi:MAG: VWA domain-containing protein [Candidatus Viridilinea halotolerans]|uniref:VWA domain-containing protein n=1 Tax=Candidatus Viridilinea halotolerans TaxID=2491704 RepID=A0A426TZD7_9CHLR|nr:MAG: VWA domain-containing protein [Candidatus Viridilinea halotolerans]
MTGKHTLRLTLHLALLLFVTFASVLPVMLPRQAAAADLADIGLPLANFDNNALPQGWSVLPASGPGWTFNNPGSRTNMTRGSGGFAIADSDHAGRAAMDTELRTPAFSLSGAANARLSFDHIFQPHGQSTAAIDYSVDGGTTWVNLWQQTVQSSGKIGLGLPVAALGQANVILRFRYYNANYDWFWQLDNIQVTAEVARPKPSAPTNLSAQLTNGQVALSWVDRSTNETGFRVERSADGTNWATLSTLPANSTSTRDERAACGSTLSYRVVALLAGGDPSDPSNVAQVTTSECVGVTSINESFDAAPANWTLNPATGATWRFDDPRARTNRTGGTGTFAMVDSDLAGDVPMNASLQTPLLNFAAAQAVRLSFKTSFLVQTRATADVDVSSDNGANWTNVWRKTANFDGPVELDISRHAAGKANVLVRFRYYNATYDWFWQVDDVRIEGLAPPAAPTNLSASLGGNGQINLAWNGGGAPRFEIQRAPATGDTWAKLADVSNGATTFVDDSVASKTTYRYRVKAINAAGASAWSAVATRESGDRTSRTFDVTISLYRNEVTPELRANYERILRYFAESVYEMSNGAQKLGNVKIYLGGANKDSAHIVWVATCHPSANVSGYGRPGDQVNMCDVFNDQLYLTSDGWAQVGGFGSLGHEWGHYFYGLYDEYRNSEEPCDPNDPGGPCVGDTPVPYAMMNNGDDAGNNPDGGQSGDLRWGNFSTARNNTRNTAQHRIFGASSWETLVRPPSEDPRDGQRNRTPTRLHWPELAAVAPGPNETHRVTLVNETARQAARSAMTINWLNSAGQVIHTTGPQAALAQNTTGVVRQFVIDHSARISNTQVLATIKDAVSQQIDAANIGDTIGIIAFGATPTVVQAPLTINSAADRTTLKNALNGITPQASGAADLSAALQTALGNLPESLNRYVILITGGAETTGNPSFAQAGAYQAAGVPIFAFAYPSNAASESILQQLALTTEGAYQAVGGSGRSGLASALQEMRQTTTPELIFDLAEDVMLVEAEATQEVSFTVDSTLGSVDLFAVIDGQLGDATVALSDPDGNDVQLQCAVDDDGGDPRDVTTVCTATLEGTTLKVGTWKLVATADARELFIFYWIEATAAEGEFAYTTTVAAVDGALVNYPDPIIVRASLQREVLVTGLHVTARLVTPDGSERAIMLHDDGNAPDAVANDGEYTGIFDYEGDGEYYVLVDFDNRAGTAKTTLASYQLQRGSNPPAPVTLTENFQRHAATQITVRGWQEDDHTEELDTATPLPLDNSPVGGRIDFADDGDTFKLTVPEGGAGNIVIRVADLALGMDPVVFIFSEDGSIDIVDILDAQPTGNDYLVVPLSVKAGQVFYVTVTHLDEEAVTGYYSISAGPALPLEGMRSLPTKITFPVYLPLVAR